MNRRTFLKSLATVCGAAVVCPGELLKSIPVVAGVEPGWYDVKFESGWRKHLWMRGKDGSYIEGEIFDEFASSRDIKYPWKHISIPFHYET